MQFVKAVAHVWEELTNYKGKMDTQVVTEALANCINFISTLYKKN